ncbi:MAG: glycoside hydrolase family 38 [Chloroflexi bacterium]|nr:glycoside hydrolase family 38 [Chloroflexota bacterium]
MQTRRCHYVLSTHWDREWYQTFQDFRYRLVQLIDRVLAGWEDGRLKGPLQTDGQVIVLDDYLEIRPEKRAEIEQAVQSGQIVAGPWYVLPDEFLVSGESLIRNLRMGRKIVRSYGGMPSEGGFVCDLFGHNSQLPQILSGFGIQAAFVWRGSNQTSPRHFIWQSPDGSEVLAYRFGHNGYCSYCSKVRQTRDASIPFDAALAAHNLDEYLQEEADATEIDPILLFDGGDHQEWDPFAYKVLEARMADRELFDIVHTSLDTYLKEALPQRDRVTKKVVGELREPAAISDGQVDNQWLIPGVLSSRVWIRQENAACQAALCSWAEPLNTYANLLIGREYPQGYLDVAWKWLLQNHPHDSICGCSIDAVHRDMQYRYHQTRGIAERITVEAARSIAANVAGEPASDELRVVVFNPLARAIDTTVELDLEIPVAWPTFNEFFGFEPKPAFRIYDADDNEIPYQRLGQTMSQLHKRIAAWHFPQAYSANHVRVSLPLAVGAQGYTTLTVRACYDNERFTRHPAVPGLATSECAMENEFVRVEIEPNGTLNILDKRNNQRYERLLTFDDSADIGDGWYWGQAVNDQIFSSRGAQAEIALVHDGPMLTTFRVRTRLQLPSEFDFASMQRSASMCEVVIDSFVSLRPKQTCVEVETRIDNVAKDHRMRVLFPSGADTATYLSDTPYDVVERPIALRADNHTYKELEIEGKAQQSWTAVHDATRGLAVISDGLLESAVRDLPDRPIALTLFRGTRRTVFTRGEPDGQLNDTLKFRYLIVPLTGAPERSDLFDRAQRLLAGLHVVQFETRDVRYYRTPVELAPSGSLLSVSAPAVVTSIQQLDGSLELRMFNPNEQTADIQVNLDASVMARYTKWGLVNLESQPLGKTEQLSKCLCVPLGAKQFVTICMS